MYKENTDTISIITGSTCAQVAIDDIEFIDREGKSLLIYTSSYIYKTFAKIDDIAYIRFASVYRQFTDRKMFLKELERMSMIMDSQEK